MKKFISYFIFYLLQLTWGLIMNIYGLLVTIVMLITLHKPHGFGPNYYFILRHAKACGFECGICFCISKDCSENNLMLHEAGHSIQNLIFGPLTLFLCAIPSLIRFWYREIIYKIDAERYWKLPSYDSFWVEHQATKLGERYYDDWFYYNIINPPVS